MMNEYVLCPNRWESTIMVIMMQPLDVKRDFVVSLPPEEAAEILSSRLTDESNARLFGTRRSTELLDDYRIDNSGCVAISQIFTRFYARIGAFVTLVVIMHSVCDRTAVHATIGGHKEFWEGNDLGASGSFLDLVEEALQPYTLKQA